MKDSGYQLRILVLAVLSIASASIPAARDAFGQATNQVAPRPEMKALESRVGKWKYHGEVHASPFGPAGKFEGEQELRMVLNGTLLEHRWKDVTQPNYVAEGINLTGFDHKNNRYVEYSFENDGHQTVSVLSTDGRTWGSTSDRVGHDGKTYQVRWTLTMSDDGNLDTAKSEYSGDGGQSWQLYFTLTAKRVQGGGNARLQDDDIPTEVRALSAAYDAALLASDVATLDKIYASDCVFIGPDGSIRDKAALLEEEKQTKLESNQSKNRSFRRHGDAIHEVGEYVAKGTVKGEAVSWHFRYSNLWTYRDGRWQLALDHVTPIAEK